MRNGRCRMHGGKSTGPRTAEGLARLRAAARARHGGEAAAEVRAFERSCRTLIRATRVLLALAERPAEDRPTLDLEALLDAPLLLPQAGLPSGPPLPPSGQTGGKSPSTVRTALPDRPPGLGDQATVGLGFGPFGALDPPHAIRQDPMHRERRPLLGPSAVRIALPALAPAARPSAGARAAREHGATLDQARTDRRHKQAP